MINAVEYVHLQLISESLRWKCKLNAQKNTPSPSNKRSQKPNYPQNLQFVINKDNCDVCNVMNYKKGMYLIVCRG